MTIKQFKSRFKHWDKLEADMYPVLVTRDRKIFTWNKNPKATPFTLKTLDNAMEYWRSTGKVFVQVEEE